jgi:hypothetical protein
VEVVAQNLAARPAEILQKLGWTQAEYTSGFHNQITKAKAYVERQVRAGGTPPPRNEAYANGEDRLF